jgi:hypothetical protein
MIAHRKNSNKVDWQEGGHAYLSQMIGRCAGSGEDEDVDRDQGGETLISWNNAQGGDHYNPSLRIPLL